MRRFFLCAFTCLSGCSLVYDFASFEGGAGDAGPPDVNPANLSLDRVLTDPLVEGTGCVPVAEPLFPRVAGEAPVTACAPESPRVPVLVEGSDILPDAVVTLTGMGFASEVVDSVVSSDGSLVGFEIAVPVDVGLAAGETATLVVSVAQDGAEPQTIDVEVTGLDELVASSFGDPAAAVAELAAGKIYSTITIDEALDLVGSAPFHLQATSQISIQQPLSARGRSAEDVDRQTRRAGGCPGGNAASTGGCGQMGGGAGPSGGGGGGGGNQSDGVSGGSGNGNGGPATLGGLLVPLAEHAGRGGGGANGVVGGDGGGLIALTSAGQIEIAATIDVAGGGGEDSGGLVGCTGLGGPGGGGGAGGSVLLRGRHQIALAGGAAITLAGGSGGTGTGIGGGDCAGGAGSVGRLRVDTPALLGDLGAIVAEPDVAPVVGAIIDVQSQLRSGPSQQTITLSGDTANSPVTWISVNDTVESFSFETERTVELDAGLNEVCVHVTDPSMGEPEESRHCVAIAYLP